MEPTEAKQQTESELDLSIDATPSQTVPPEPRGTPVKRSDVSGDTFKSKVYLAIIVAVLSFVGALAGSLASGKIAEARWERETRFAIQKETYLKRSELLERTIRLLSNIQTLDVVSATAAYSLAEGEGLIRKGASAQEQVSSVAAAAAKAKELQGELSVVMTMDAIYFGPQTRRAVATLQLSHKATKPWWNVDSNKTQALLDALASELTFGIVSE
jgi:hypothetical protein